MSTSDKLLSVLGLFTIESPEWTVEAAAKHLGLAVSTTYRFFRSLSGAGLIVAFTTGRYVLGPAIVQLDRQTRLLDPLIKTARPIMQRLVFQTRVPGVLLLCRLYRDQVMCVHQEYSGDPDRVVSYERGRLMPLHRGAPSKIILAHMPARPVRAFHRDHAADMEAVSLGQDWDEVKQRLRQLRAAGVAISHAELDPGMTGMAAPLFGPDGGIVGSLCFVLPDADGSPDVVTGLSGLLQSAGQEISAGLEALAGSDSASEESAAAHDGIPLLGSKRSPSSQRPGRSAVGGKPEGVRRRVAARR